MDWSLALTQPNREFAAARALVRWDVPYHLFKIRRRVALRGTTRDRLCPAFPGYLFVAADGAWDFLRERCAIARFLCRQLPDRTVPSLVQAAGADDVIPMIELPSQRFRQGERVLIQGMSLLAGHHAIFQNLTNETDAIVLVDWMGRWVPVAVDERDLTTESSSRVRQRRRRRGRKRRKDPRRIN